MKCAVPPHSVEPGMGVLCLFPPIINYSAHSQWNVKEMIKGELQTVNVDLIRECNQGGICSVSRHTSTVPANVSAQNQMQLLAGSRRWL
ncbi:hypothetical protein SRHO_G00111330 [Serrasalmus rhombeus]